MKVVDSLPQQDHMADTLMFKKLQLKRYTSVQQRETSEVRFWKKFQTNDTQRYTAAASSLHFSPVATNEVAVSTSLSVVLHDCKEKRTRKTLSRFNDVAYSARYRHDGRLIAAGGEEGIVRTFDAASGASLRQLQGHKAPVHAVRWSHDGLHLMSASDDKLLKLFDVSCEECVWTGGGHADYARAVASSGPHHWISGSYDHKACLWDTRTRDTRPVFRCDHGAPIEDVLSLPGGSLFAVAGGNSISIVDILSGRVLHTLANHQKTITCLSLDHTQSRLLSGALDGHVKIVSLSSFLVVHGFKYESPVLSMAVGENLLAVGTSDLALNVRRREIKPVANERKSVAPERIDGGSAHYFDRGKNVKAASSDDRAASEAFVQRKQRLRPYDIALRKFRYHEALDAALACRNPTVVVTVLEELVHRDGLLKAISGRDECTLEPLLSFLSRYTINPRYSVLLVDICRIVFELYQSVIGQSEAIDELFTRLGRQVKQEIGLQKEFMKLMGCLGAVMRNAEPR